VYDNAGTFSFLPPVDPRACTGATLLHQCQQPYASQTGAIFSRKSVGYDGRPEQRFVGGNFRASPSSKIKEELRRPDCTCYVGFYLRIAFRERKEPGDEIWRVIDRCWIVTVKILNSVVKSTRLWCATLGTSGSPRCHEAQLCS
jgi:hypothetical protein